MKNHIEYLYLRPAKNLCFDVLLPNNSYVTIPVEELGGVSEQIQAMACYEEYDA